MSSRTLTSKRSAISESVSPRLTLYVTRLDSFALLDAVRVAELPPAPGMSSRAPATRPALLDRPLAEASAVTETPYLCATPHSVSPDLTTWTLDFFVANGFWCSGNCEVMSSRGAASDASIICEPTADAGTTND